MPIGLTHLIYVLIEFLRIPFDVIRGIKRRSYVISFGVDAPKDVTWAVVSANKITLAGRPPITIDTEPDATRPGVFKGDVSYGDKRLAFAYRILDMRAGEAISLEIIEAESDPAYHYGSDYSCAIGVFGDANASSVTTTHDLTHERLATRVLMPISQVASAARIRRTARQLAGREVHASTDRVQAAIITGALTFASFFALFGPSVAAMLLGVILVHELGHVVAMRWAGIPVRGIYFVPFFGGVAVGDGVARTELQRGLVALMGPGFSLLPTALLIFASAQSGDETLDKLAFTSAALNGFNLLPIFPLDGGHIMQALLSRTGRETLRAFQAVTLFAGIVLAGWVGDLLLMALLGLVGPSTLKRSDPSTPRIPMLTRSDTVWLSVAYAASFMFYVLSVVRTW
ncbi:MAG: site-2 protease family protein [Hyphomicrobium sp.]|nr:site-2 protease family protein [Hyphomicrobium sp.]